MSKNIIIEKIKDRFNNSIDLEDLEILEEEENIKISLYIKINNNKRLYKIK